MIMPQLYGGGPPVSGVTDSSDADFVKQLLAALGPELQQPGPPTPPTPAGPARNVLGSLGDALLSMSSVRSGHGPIAIGPFAAGQKATQHTYEQRQAEYEKRIAENAQADRTLRKQVMISTIGRGRIGPLDAVKLKLEQEQGAERGRHNLAMENKPPSPDYQLAYDQSGNAYWSPKPGSGATGPVAAMTPEGQRATKPPNPNVMGNLISTKNVLNDLDSMEKLLDAANQGGTVTTDKGEQLYIPAQSTAGRIVASGAQAVPGLRTIGGYINPASQLHEALRQKLVLELNRPITQQNRLLQAEVTQMLKNVPDFGTNPIVYKGLLSNLRGSIQNIDRIQTNAYPVEAKATISSETQGDKWQGIVLHEADFATASPGERERFLAGGGRIEP